MCTDLWWSTVILALIISVAESLLQLHLKITKPLRMRVQMPEGIAQAGIMQSKNSTAYFNKASHTFYSYYGT